MSLVIDGTTCPSVSLIFQALEMKLAKLTSIVDMHTIAMIMFISANRFVRLP